MSVSNVNASKSLKEVLGLSNEPVGIMLISKDDEIPDWFPIVSEPLRHCQAIMRARAGESMTVPVDKQLCGTGAAAMGMVPLADNVRSGEFHSNMGVYGSADAAKKALELSPSIPSGNTIATIVAPLSRFDVEPDVVVVTGTPEQMFWIVPVSASYNEGAPAALEISSIQAACADSTMRPILTGRYSMSLGCFGCRKTTDIAPEEMLVGIPGKALAHLEVVIGALGRGPVPKSRSK